MSIYSRFPSFLFSPAEEKLSVFTHVCPEDSFTHINKMSPFIILSGSEMFFFYFFIILTAIAVIFMK